MKKQMKNRFAACCAAVLLMSLMTTGCTLSTTGLRPVADHSLARDSITEVYDKPAASE